MCSPPHPQNATSPIALPPLLLTSTPLSLQHRSSPHHHTTDHQPPPHPNLPSTTSLRSRTRRSGRAPRRRGALSSRTRPIGIRRLARIRHRLDARAVSAAPRLRFSGEGHVGALSPPTNISRVPRPDTPNPLLLAQGDDGKKTHVIKPPRRIPIRNHLDRRIHPLTDIHSVRRGYSTETEFPDAELLKSRQEGDVEV